MNATAECVLCGDEISEELAQIELCPVCWERVERVVERMARLLLTDWPAGESRWVPGHLLPAAKRHDEMMRHGRELRR